MKTILFTFFAFVFSISPFTLAKMTTVTCSHYSNNNSNTDTQFKVKVNIYKGFEDHGIVSLNSMTDQVLFDARDIDFQQVVASEKSSNAQLMKSSALVKDLKNKAIGNSQFTSYILYIVGSKNDDGKSQSAKEILNNIGDDGSGVVYATFYDSKENAIGSSLFFGWAGYFNNCN